MKPLPLVLILCLPAALAATEVQVGDSVAEVRRVMGSPRGDIRVGDRQVLYFERGEVELRADVVTKVALLSSEEHAEREAQHAVRVARAREEYEILRSRRVTEGEALKARKQADSAFLASPVTYQAAFWEDFSRRYPEVPCAELLAVARARLQEQQESENVRLAQERRLAELEARIQETAERVDYPSYGGIRYRTRNYYRHHRRDDGWDDRHEVSYQQGPYRLYEYPLPYATSPGMPPLIPKYRDESPVVFRRVDDRQADREDHTRRAGRGRVRF